MMLAKNKGSLRKTRFNIVSYSLGPKGKAIPS